MSAAGAPNPEFLVVGQLNKVHGIKGEFYVWSLTDHPETTFQPGNILQVGDPKGERPSDRFPPLQIASVRDYKQGFLVSFVGIGDRTEAERFRGRYLLVPFEDVPELEEGEVFYHQLLGMRVESLDGGKLGTVREVYEVGNADLLEIQGPSGLFHVPFSESMIHEIDVDGGRLVLDPPEGLLEE